MSETHHETATERNDESTAADETAASNAATANASGPSDVHHVGEPIAFDGYVDDFEHRITAIKFSLDSGATWTAYETPGTVAEKGLNWHFVYTPTHPGHYLLKVRAVSGNGKDSALIENYAFEVLP